MKRKLIKNSKLLRLNSDERLRDKIGWRIFNVVYIVGWLVWATLWAINGATRPFRGYVDWGEFWLLLPLTIISSFVLIRLLYPLIERSALYVLYGKFKKEKRVKSMLAWIDIVIIALLIVLFALSLWSFNS